MRRIVYWSRPLESDEARQRADQIAADLKAAAGGVDVDVERWDDIESDAEFFDRLDSLTFEQIDQGVIVVLDRVTLDSFEFAPVTMFDSSSTSVRQEREKRGAAASLVLRYPEVWPVFLMNDSDRTAVLQKFKYLEAVLPKADAYCDAITPAMMYAHVVGAFQHHVLEESSLRRAARDGALPRVLEPPVLGAMSIFDPTGLRTVTKALLLYRLLLHEKQEDAARDDRDGAHAATVLAVSSLLGRVRQPAVVVEEEADVAYLNAYSAFRHGRRVWTVTNYRFFKHGIWREDRLWARKDSGGSALVLRDFDLRFVDMPVVAIPDEDAPNGRRRLNLAHIEDWRCGDAEQDAPINTWIDEAVWRTCSSYNAVIAPTEVQRDRRSAWTAADWRLGRFANVKRGAKSAGAAKAESGELLGARKPVAHVLFVTAELEDSFRRTARVTPRDRWAREPRLLSSRTLLARLDLRRIRSGSGSHHAPPPVTLEIAASLLDRVRRLRAIGHPRASLHAAVFAQEAYEVLMGKSQSTSMESLLQLYLCEAEMETQGIGLSSRTELHSKERDIDLTLNNVFDGGDINEIIRKRDYAAKVWSGVRTIFRDADMFQAATEANLYVLMNQSWFGARKALWNLRQNIFDPFGWGKRQRIERALAPNRVALDQRALRAGRIRLHTVNRPTPLTDRTKKIVSRIATDPGDWAKAFFLFWVGATVVKVGADLLALYLTDDKALRSREWADWVQQPGSILLVALSSQFGPGMAPTRAWELFFQFYQIAFLSINTLFMAFLIAMIVRQVTRD